MKIGLIGINKYAKFLNFACQLHVFAFQKYLDQQGYDSVILDYKPVYFNGFDMRHPAPGAEKKYRDAVVARRSAETLQDLADLAVGYRSVSEARERRFDAFEAFERRHLRYTEEEYDSDLLEIQDPDLDCYICVTDVIWQSRTKHVFDRGFLLGSKAFEGKPKIAYAASRGTSTGYTAEQLEAFQGYLDDIDAISVREQAFQEYIEENTTAEVTTVLDPVLLHDRAFWQGIAVAPTTERYLLLYYVMERAEDTIRKAVEYAKLHDLTIVELSDRPSKHGRVTDPDVRHVTRYDVSMEEWLGYIEHADAVFTNSFHGCCFSVLFETPLFAGRREEEKLSNFLCTFGLSEQQFAPDADVAMLSTAVDYSGTRQILEELRGHSSDFLLTALEAARSRTGSRTRAERAPYDARRRELSYPVHVQSGELTDVTLRPEDAEGLRLKKVSKGATEYFTPGRRVTNDGRWEIPPNLFVADGFEHAGWTLRFRIDNRWFWYMDDGAISLPDLSDPSFESRKAVLAAGTSMVHLPVNHVGVAVLVSQWRKLPPSPEAPQGRRDQVGRKRPLVPGLSRILGGRNS